MKEKNPCCILFSLPTVHSLIICAKLPLVKIAGQQKRHGLIAISGNPNEFQEVWILF